MTGYGNTYASRNYDSSYACLSLSLHQFPPSHVILVGSNNQQDQSTGLLLRIIVTIDSNNTQVGIGNGEMNDQVAECFLYAVIKIVGMDVAPPVKVGTCRALSHILPDATSGIIQHHALDLFSSLIELLTSARGASDETMHLVLETLQAAMISGHEVAASIELVVSPSMLSMWASHISDPFINIDALEVLEVCYKKGSWMYLSFGFLSFTVYRANPHNPQQQPDGLVAGSMDLVTILVKNAPTDVLKAAYQVLFYTVVRIVLQSNDHSRMQKLSLN
ncbi:hypothetical protein OROMI_014660 [Orobanche minor]